MTTREPVTGGTGVGDSTNMEMGTSSTVDLSRSTSMDDMYQYLREFLTANNIPIAHSVENFNALINTFFGRTENGVWSEEEMLRHFETYRNDDGTIQEQAATDINNYLASIGYTEATFDAAPSEDSGPIQAPAADDGTGIVDDTVQPRGTGTGVLSGGTTYRIQREGQEDIYVEAYEWPPGTGQVIYFQYDSLEQAQAALGDDFSVQLQTEKWLRENGNPAGSAAEVIGNTGTFNKMMDDIIYNTMRAAGINDPTVLGQMMQNEEIQNIFGQAAIGDWTDAQTTAAIRNSTYYTDVLYPGIDNFYGSTANPEAAYALYTQNVSANLYALGIQRDADGTYKSTIATLLDGGVSDTALATFTPTYVRAAGNDQYRQNLNRWLGAAGMSTIDTFDGFFDLLAGAAPTEVNEVVELASLSYTAQNQGLSIADDLFRQIGQRTDLTEEGMARAFSEVDRSLIALGDSGLRNYGVTQSDIIQAAFGYTIGDMSPEETKSLINKIATEQGISDDPTARLYTDYNREGAPVKLGLGANVSEGA